MYRSSQSSSHGFTLIEVLVAIAIFASLSIGAYQVLNQVQRSNELSLERSERLKTLQRTLVFMDNDFRQMALRQSRTNGEEPSLELIHWQDYLLDSDAKGVMFVRSGWHNPQQQFPRGEVSKVGYRLKEGELQRVWWRYVDTPVGQEGIVMPLIDKVDSFDLRFYDGNQWLERWETNYTLPKAVLVKLVFEDYGAIERIYLTAGGALEVDEEQNADGS
ncbi:type II secretion system minor pseudopilin GspJ [Vibrio sp. TRT 29B02]|uniref:type II secretion system minor pseudopilin GspJ n=1 Tax=unclassified Vibrio TaxID=2614977 RepID=UPI003CF35E07